MKKYVKSLERRTVSLYAIQVKGGGGLEYLMRQGEIAPDMLDELDKCDDNGLSSRFGEVLRVCFRGKHSWYEYPDLDIPYATWVSLGKPRELIKREETSYSPKKAKPTSSR